MIRFTCPECGAKYKVPESKGGKAGKCRKCQVPFLVPLPPAAAPPPPPPILVVAAAPPAPPSPPPPVLDAIPVYEPPPVTTGLEAPPAPPPPTPPPGVEIAPCPGCRAQLTVDPACLGDNVECPHCKMVFAAVRPGAVMPAPTSRFIEAEVVRPTAPERDASPPADANGKVKKIFRTVGGTRTISRIGILSAAKMSAGMSFVGGVLYDLIYGGIFLVFFLTGLSMGAPGEVLGAVGLYAICFLIMVPLLMGLFGFIGGAIWALIYNLLAQLMGGVEVDLE